VFAVLLLPLILLFCVAAFLFHRPRSTYWRGRTISVRTQSLKGGAFSEDRLWVRNGWYDPAGHRHSELYGLKIGSKLFRLDITFDPVSDINKHLPNSIPGLLKELESKDGLVQQCALGALTKLGPDAAPALPLLFDRYATVKGFPDWSIVEVSKAIGPGAVPVLTKELTNANPKIQSTAIEALSEMGTNAVAAVTDLARLLTNAPPTNIVAAAYALSRIERGDHGEVTALTRMLDNPDKTARAGAILVLAEFHEDAAPAANALLKVMGEANREEADWAARTFGAMGSAGTIAIPQLIHFLDHLSETNTTFPIEALSDFGDAATPALPKLFEIASNPQHSQFTFTATKALGKIGTNSIPYLLRLYDQEKPDYWTLSTTVTILGPRAAPLVPRLVAELDKAGRATAAAIALGAIGEPASAAAAALSLRTRNDDPGLRVRAAEALWHIAHDTNTVMSTMIAELIDWSKGTNAFIQLESSHGMNPGNRLPREFLRRSVLQPRLPSRTSRPCSAAPSRNNALPQTGRSNLSSRSDYKPFTLKVVSLLLECFRL
jgi:HEAT repeat protein